ncbi:MAG: hypothetical protein ACRD34_16370, partial [Bryobacteraceae bacterium]
MSEGALRYCDVALPLPLDRLFTYSCVPEEQAGRGRMAQTGGPATRVETSLDPARKSACATGLVAGCRVEVPFGSRKLTGVVLRVHNDAPEYDVRQILRVIDAEPVLDDELLRLGRWIGEYYCAPVGEVFKGMLPLAGERRRSVRYTLTDLGRSLARQLTVGPEIDPASQILSLLEER